MDPRQTDKSQSVLIAGGGLAGLAAAVALAEHNIRVTLLESRPRLGGRAGSFLDQTTRELIDNCQHVSMGCCTNFQHFCKTVGIDDQLRTEDKLFFIGPDNVINHFSAGPFPAPLHLLSTFRKLSYLSRNDLKAISRGLRALIKIEQAKHSTQSFKSWLEEQQQPSNTIKHFWDVVLVSALSESLDRIDITHARKVFVDAFLANRNGWKVQIPTVPLDQLYGTQLIEWLKSRGATIQLKSGISHVHIENNAVSAVELRDGKTLSADQYILALPHHLVSSLLPESLAAHPELEKIKQLQTAPISSVHLWFDRSVTELPHAVLVGRMSQWMFNRTVLKGRAENAERGTKPESGFYYQVVISESRNLAKRSQEEIIAGVLRELQEIWPESAEAKLLHFRIVTEHKAVFSPLPGIEELRLPQQSPIANLQFAGDWTRTGWPATMEGAVRSGYLAAQNVLRHFGHEESLIQHDLPVSLLSKWLFGL